MSSGSNYENAESPYYAAEREGIIEKSKAENQMLWAGKMNAVREAATKIVNNDLIYTRASRQGEILADFSYGLRNVVFMRDILTNGAEFIIIYSNGRSHRLR